MLAAQQGTGLTDGFQPRGVSAGKTGARAGSQQVHEHPADRAPTAPCRSPARRSTSSRWRVVSAARGRVLRGARRHAGPPARRPARAARSSWTGAARPTWRRASSRRSTTPGRPGDRREPGRPPPSGVGLGTTTAPSPTRARRRADPRGDDPMDWVAALSTPGPEQAARAAPAPRADGPGRRPPGVAHARRPAGRLALDGGRHRQPGRGRGHDRAARQAAHVRGPQPLHAHGPTSSPSSRPPRRSAVSSGVIARWSCATSSSAATRWRTTTARSTPPRAPTSLAPWHGPWATVLTPYQRRIAVALLVDGVPSTCSPTGSARTGAPSTRRSTRPACDCAPSSIASGYLTPPGGASTRQEHHARPRPPHGPAPDAQCGRRAPRRHHAVAVVRRLLRADGHATSRHCSPTRTTATTRWSTTCDGCAACAEEARSLLDLLREDGD